MRDKLEGDATRYQAGTVNGISYFRCEDLVTELKEFVKECALAGQLTRRLGAPDDSLRVTVSIDKGGSYTKAFITVWDVDQSLSPLHAVFMGVYAGGDDYESIKAVFGPAIAQLERAAPNIDWPYHYGSITVPAAAAAQSNTVIRPYLSDECDECKALKAAGAVQTTIRTTPYRSIRICWGGDIMVLHELLGTKGPNATYSCHMCVMPKKQLKTTQTPSSNPPALRTTTAATAHSKESLFGTKKTIAERSLSHKRAPLFTSEIAGHTGPSPLHVKMGLTKDLLTELKDETAKLDETPLKERRWFIARRMHTPKVVQFRDLCLRGHSLRRDQNRTKERLEKMESKLKHLLPQGMMPEIEDTTTSINKLKEDLKSTGQALSDVTKELKTTDGPFTGAVKDELLKHHIRERKYHSGEYVGGDCDRIMEHGDTIANCCRRTQLIDVNGDISEGGDDAIAAKYVGLFAKLSECSKLFSAARALCSHEIKRLEQRSAELAALWPRTFTPKFHLMRFHMPQFARDWGSIGLASEQCVESSHRLFNSLDITFAGVTNMILKLKSMGKRFRLRSSRTVPDYTPPKRARTSSD